MFELRNVDSNVLVKADIVGYQFPDSPEDDWCFLSIVIEQGQQFFEKTDPALEAKDIINIYDWFNALATTSLPSYATLSFIEPCISFSYLAYREGKVRFSVNLDHELKPNFELEQFKQKNNEWQLVFELDKVQLHAVLESIKNTMKKFPVREKC